MRAKTKIRDFHQARWNEPIIFDLSTPGERGILLPEIEPEVEASAGGALDELPGDLKRSNPPGLPEMAQMRVLKHYLRLSQENLGADLNVDIGQGTCTMKYSPKINEQFAASPQLSGLHPAQNEDTVQGTLEIMYQLEQFLKAISGMDRFSLQPGGGSHAILAIVSMIRAWVDDRGLSDTKDEIITTIFSHPSNCAVARTKGFKVINIYPDPKTGRPDLDAFKEAVSERTAALLITNPEDTGIYNENIKEFTDLVHAHGGLCSYDQANANGIMGITRAANANFDFCFFNIHKTFSSPHGCGGPGCGVVGVKEHLIPYLPVPLTSFDEANNRYYLDYDVPKTIGKIKDYYGVIPAIIRAYAWIRSLGAEGLLEAARVAVLNNNYILNRIRAMKGAEAPYAEGEHRIEQVRYSFQPLKEETGCGFDEVQRRICDFMCHLWSSHEPFVVPEPFTIEPTESYSREEIDEYLAALEKIIEEAYTNPDVLKTAPHNSSIHHIAEHEYLDDPKLWAVTWRMYNNRFEGYFEPKKEQQ